MTLDDLAHACTCRSTLTSEPIKPSGPEGSHRYASVTGPQLEESIAYYSERWQTGGDGSMW